jgi:hypothetical protein
MTILRGHFEMMLGVARPPGWRRLCCGPASTPALRRRRNSRSASWRPRPPRPVFTRRLNANPDLVSRRSNHRTSAIPLRPKIVKTLTESPGSGVTKCRRRASHLPRWRACFQTCPHPNYKQSQGRVGYDQCAQHDVRYEGRLLRVRLGLASSALRSVASAAGPRLRSGRVVVVAAGARTAEPFPRSPLQAWTVRLPGSEPSAYLQNGRRSPRRAARLAHGTWTGAGPREVRT